MALMCEECKCSTYLNEDTGMYSCESGCACCNDLDYESDWDTHTRTMKQITEYLKLHKLSLEQDLSKLNCLNEFGQIWQQDEIVNIGGQIIATNHILKYIDELDKTGYERV